MSVVNTDGKYYLSKTPEKCIQEAARAKKKMYLEACLQQRWHFPPFVISIDGLLYVDAAAILKRIPSHLTKKWQQPKSRICRYAKSSIAITLVRATHRCIWGYRLPSRQISVQRLHWEDGARINLFR